MPPDRYPPSYSDTPGACPQARHKPLSSPTAVPRVRSCPCRITLHLSAKSPFHGPEAIQRTTSTASRCKRDSAALRTAGVAPTSLPPLGGRGKFDQSVNDRGQALGMASGTTATGKVKVFGQPGEVPGWVNYALLPVLNLVA